MKLYRYKYAISVIPSWNTEEATDKYNAEIDSNIAMNKSDFEVLICHEDFVKLFRLARTLSNIDQYDCNDIEALVDAYAKKLGYSLTPSELWHGILKWVERFSDTDDEDIEDWLN